MVWPAVIAAGAAIAGGGLDYLGNRDMQKRQHSAQLERS